MKQKEIKNEAVLGPTLGPYSQAIQFQNLFFTAQIGGTLNKTPISDSAYEQAVQAFKNANLLLSQVNSNLDNILKLTIYLTDLNDYPEVNRACQEMLVNTPRPSRATIEINRLPAGAKVELDIIAFCESAE